MNVLKLSLLILLPALIPFFGCQKSKKIQSSNNRVIHINGDPIAFVKGTNNNGNSTLPLELFSDTAVKWSGSTTGFVQSSLNASSYDNILKEQTPSDNAAAKTLESTTEKTWQVKTIEESIVFTDDKTSFQFRLLENNQDVQLAKISYGDQGYEIPINGISIVHVSYTLDLKAFSLLIYVKGSPKALLKYTFVKNSEWNLDSLFTESIYQYLFGRGVLIRWSNEANLNLTICDSVPKGAHPSFKKAVQRWSDPLQNRLEIATDENEKNCPPFSDLNVHGLYYINDWIEVIGPSGVLGQTLSYIGSEGKLLDSDILILAKELQESIQVPETKLSVLKPKVHELDEYIEFLYSHFLHELGHVLGLHHQFDKQYPSIMSYDYQTDLTEYDYEAIQSLYPLKEPKTSKE